MNKSMILALAIAVLTSSVAFSQDASTSASEEKTSALQTILQTAERLDPLETVIVARNGEIIAEREYGGNSLDEPTNIKSASKTIITALVGIAIDKGLLEGTEQKIAPLLENDLPDNADPRLQTITIGNLMSMQAGLEATSGPNYGRWVGSRNWVRGALSREFVDEPGGRMLYSTGSSHLLSAILTKVGGKSTLALAREWLGAVDGFTIGGWERDPQGIYLGGNEMAMSPKSLLAFGELYRNGGKNAEGEQVVSAEWITQSWQKRTNSRFGNDGYGYGWFLRQIGGQDVKYAWGYGGQMLYIVPALGLSVLMTSDENSPAASTGHRDSLHALLEEIIAQVSADETVARPPAA